MPWIHGKKVTSRSKKRSESLFQILFSKRMFVQEKDNNAQHSMAAPAVACIQAGLDTRQHAW
jgi:hypothetical protein